MKKKEKVSAGNWFSKKLLNWNRNKNSRQMPWKGEKNPYRIWLSEIILQQTRVEQGLSYYTRFIHAFPNINALANAPEAKIFKLWEGLGYYSRCRNLITTAKYISREKKGKFPDTYEEIKSLKGIGPYTASAISSFAFNLPYAVLDGNVFRVLSRVFGINQPIDSAEGKKFFAQLANELLDKTQPGMYNQAIMDFGAVICKPVPLCDNCVFVKTCYAFLNKKINELPVKNKKIKIKTRWFYYLVIKYGNKVLILQREAKDIWRHLYEFMLVETKAKSKLEEIVLLAEKMGLLKRNKYEIMSFSPEMKQQLSHQLIKGQFIIIQIKQKPDKGKEHMWIEPKKYFSICLSRVH